MSEFENISVADPGSMQIAIRIILTNESCPLFSKSPLFYMLYESTSAERYLKERCASCISSNLRKLTWNYMQGWNWTYFRIVPLRKICQYMGFSLFQTLGKKEGELWRKEKEKTEALKSQKETLGKIGGNFKEEEGNWGIRKKTLAPQSHLINIKLLATQIMEIGVFNYLWWNVLWK